MLMDSYITCLIAASGNETFISVYHSSQLHNKCKSLLVDMWANENLVDIFVLPYNKYNAPGCHLTDICSKCIIHDIVLIHSKTAKDRAKARKAHLLTSNQSFGHSSTSSCIVIITDASVPQLSTRYQAIAAWHIWHLDYYVGDFRSSELATSNDAEMNTIRGALKALSEKFNSISDIEEIHIYLDSMHVLHYALDSSIYSAQLYALKSLEVLFP